MATKYKSILVKESESERNKKHEIRVHNIGLVQLVTATNDDGNPIWQGLNASTSTAYFIYSENVQYEMTSEDMEASKWVYDTIVDEGAVVQAIYLKSYAKAQPARERSQQPRGKVKRPKVFSQRISKINPAYFEDFRHHTSLAMREGTTEDIHEEQTEFMTEEGGVDLADPTSGGLDIGFQDSCDDSQYSYIAWFENQFRTIFEQNDQEWKNQFFNSSSVTDFESFMEKWKDLVSCICPELEQFNTLTELNDQMQVRMQDTVETLKHIDFNQIITSRFNTICEKMSDKPYFYEFCFISLNKYRLDIGQLCDIMEMIDLQEYESFEKLLEYINDNDNDDESWFLNIKQIWLKGTFHKCDLDCSRYEQLAQFPWRSGLYEYFVSKFERQLKDMSIDYLNQPEFKQLQTLNEEQTLKCIVTSDSLDTFARNLTEITARRQLCSLCQHYNLPQTFYKLDLLLKSSHAGDIIKRFHVFVKELPLGSKEDSLKSLGLIYHASNFRVSEEARLMLSGNATNGYSSQLNYETNIIDEVFQKDKTEINDINMISNVICSSHPDYAEILSMECKIFSNLCETIEDVDGDIMKVYHEFKTELKNLCGQRGGDVRELFENYTALHEVFRVMKQCNPHFKVRNVQLLTVLYILFHPDPSNTKGKLVQVFTGEGKTLVVAILAGYFASKNKKVDILTSSIELSIPQMQQCKSFYSELNLSVNALDNRKSKMNYSELNVLYATPSSYIREQLNDDDPLKYRTPFKRRADICIIDEVDSLLFDSSPAVIQLSSIESTALMPLYYSLLTEIYYNVVEGYPQFEQPKDESPKSDFRQNEELLIKYLKSIFRVPIELAKTSPRERVDETLSSKSFFLFPKQEVKNLPAYFPNHESTFFHTNQLDFDPDRMLFVQIEDKFSDESIAAELKPLTKGFKEDDFTVISDTDLKSTFVWIYCQNKDIADAIETQYLIVNAVQYSLSCLTFPDGNDVVHVDFSNSDRIQTDFNKSLKIALKLDSYYGLDIGCGQVLSRFEKTHDLTDVKQKLDLVLGYLRRVHFFSYYSGEMYRSLGQLLRKEPLFPLRQSNNTSHKKHRSPKILDYELEKFLEQPLQEEEQLQRKLGWSKLKAKYKRTISYFPVSHAHHALLQFDLWIENCYKAIMYYSKNVGYIRDNKTGQNIKIDDTNTGVLQQNTRLMDGLQQYLSMKENSILNPGTLTSSLKGITQFFTEYPKIYGVTGTIGDQPTRSFLKKVYKVSITEVPSHYECCFVNKAEAISSFYRCYEYPALIFKNPVHWVDAIVESCRQHIIFNRPVLVFCQSVRTLHEVFKKALKDKFPQTGVVVYDALRRLQTTEIKKPLIILATNIAGRGTDFKVLNDEMRRAGGLHVCLTYLPKSKRVELQCIGRTARSGDKGSAQVILCFQEQENVTIEELRKRRDATNSKLLQDSMLEVNRLNLAYKLYTQFRDSMKKTYDGVLSKLNKKRHLDILHSEWEECHLCNARTIYRRSNLESKPYETWIEERKLKVFKQIMKRWKYDEKQTRIFSQAFLKNMPLNISVSYEKSRASAMKQKWAFWMKYHFWSKGITATFVKDEAESSRLLAKHALFLKSMEKGNIIIGHNVFVAKEAFSALQNKEKVYLPLYNLSELFNARVVQALSNNTKHRRHSGMALYYLAGYKFKELTRLPVDERILTDARKRLEEIKELLEKSKDLIQTENLNFFDKLCRNMHPTRLVYIQLNGIRQTFTHFVNVIEKQIDQFGAALENKNSIPYRFLLLEIEQYGVNINVGITTIDSNVLYRSIIEHCKAFGYLGFGSFAFAEYRSSVYNKTFGQDADLSRGSVKTSKVMIRTEVDRKQLWFGRRLWSWMTGGRNYKYEERNVSMIEDEIKVIRLADNHEVVYRLNNDLNVQYSSIRSTMEMNMLLLGKWFSPTQAGPRAMIMHLKTQRGILRAQDEANSTKEERIITGSTNDPKEVLAPPPTKRKSSLGLPSLFYSKRTNNTVKRGRRKGRRKSNGFSLSDKLQAMVSVTMLDARKYKRKGEEAKRKFLDVQQRKSNKLRTQYQLFVDYIDVSFSMYSDKLRKVFCVDSMNNNQEHEQNLRNCLTSTLKDKDKTFKRRLKRCFNKSDELKKSAVQWYLNQVMKPMEKALQSAEDILVMEDNPVYNDSDVASRYDGFKLEIASGWLVLVQMEIDNDFKEREKIAMRKFQDECLQVEQDVTTQVKDHLKKEATIIEGCICCNMLISLEKKLQNIADAFDIILVFAQLPLRTQLFLPQEGNPRDVERVTLNVLEATSSWNVQGNDGNCLVKLLIQLHDINRNKGLEYLTRGLDQVKQPINPIPSAVPVESNLKVSWHQHYPDAEELKEIVKNEKFSNTSSDILADSDYLLEGLHLIESG